MFAVGGKNGAEFGKCAGLKPEGQVKLTYQIHIKAEIVFGNCFLIHLTGIYWKSNRYIV